jgi:hypothetical protein
LIDAPQQAPVAALILRFAGGQIIAGEVNHGFAKDLANWTGQTGAESSQAAPKRVLRSPPKGVVTRVSTDIHAVDDVNVAIALRHIAEHYQDDYIPKDGGSPVRVKALEERDKYPEDVQHKETELFAAPANRPLLLNFVQARKTGERPVADIEEGHISSACCILANLSMELGRSLRWDAEAGRMCRMASAAAAKKWLRPSHEWWPEPTSRR